MLLSNLCFKRYLEKDKDYSTLLALASPGRKWLLQRLLSPMLLHIFSRIIMVGGYGLKHAVRYLHNLKTDRLTRTGYKHVRPDNVEDEPFVWEA